jgi:hypothetical protein
MKFKPKRVKLEMKGINFESGVNWQGRSKRRITNRCKISRLYVKSKEQSGLCDITSYAFEANLHTLLLGFKTTTSEGYCGGPWRQVYAYWLC